MINIGFTKEWIIANKIAIQCNNKKEADAVCKIFGIPISKYYDTNCFFGVDLSRRNYCFYAHNAAISYGEIIIQASEVIAKYEAHNPKIIGYRCPFDMFHQENDFLVNKGDLYVKRHDFLNCYRPEKNQASDLFAMPDEIVKTWEPVYEEFKPCFASWGDVMQFAHKKQTTVLVHSNNRINFGDIGDATQEKYSFTDEFKEELKALSIWI